MVLASRGLNGSMATPKSTGLKLGCPELNAELFEISLIFFAAVFKFYDIARWGMKQRFSGD